MKTESQSPIPVAPKVLWDQVRSRVLPLVMFLVLLAISAYLWNEVNATSTLQGVAEGTRSILVSPQPGLIAEIKVRPYQLVNQGDPIAVIRPVDPRTSLDLLQAQLGLAELRHRPSMAQENAMNYQRVRIELLRLKSELAVARIQLRRAETDVTRNLQLFREKLISEDLYDLSVASRDSLHVEVAEKTGAVDDMTGELAQLKSLGDPSSAVVDEQYEALLKGMELAHATAGTNWETIILRAPIAGMVTPTLRQVGEYVLDGEPIVGVNSLWSERVVAYLRQPYELDPEVGMEVRVTARTRKRQQFSLPIAQVGAQLEPITNALAFVRQGALVDVGLPIILNLPAGNTIRPGEVLDLRINPGKVRPTADEVSQRL